MLQMYTGLKREIYILCFGRFVTAMGSLIWPMLTLILKTKLGMNAEQVASWFLCFAIIQLPLSLAAGRITDKYNKRNLIILFDLISVVLYLITACLPISKMSLCVYFAGSLFQNVEWPAYDALIAEMTTEHDREKAYSLEYLANNLGVVFAPTLGGILFERYLWLSFLIGGLAVLSSTIFIYRYIPNHIKPAVNYNIYEKRENGSLIDLFRTRKIMAMYIFISCIAGVVYAQFNYLLPIQMDEIFMENGAMLFGILTSINGTVVILGTPFLTQTTLGWSDFKRIQLGVLLEIIGICSNYFFRKEIVLYALAMIMFTVGEILKTLGDSPYISKRIPASHRGRYTTLNRIFKSSVSSVGNIIIGKWILLYSFRSAWRVIFVVGILLVVLQKFYQKMDKKQFALLYEAEK